MDTVEVVVAHTERATLRVGNVFLKIDGDRSRLDRELQVMGMAPVPTPRILWRQPPVLALAALDGSHLGHLGEPSPSPAAAWAATGAAIRRLHDAPLPPWHGPSVEDRTARLEVECDWLLNHDVLPTEVITHNRDLARRALRPMPARIRPR